MKKSLLALALLSLALTGCSKKETDTAVEKTKDAANTAVEKTKEVATDAKNAVGNKLTEWHLTGADIKADLQKGGQVVRTKAVAAGETIANAADNARVVTVINGKLVADAELSALKINVDANAGHVTLKGTAPSEAAIGKAIALALDTDGVTQVTSELAVK